MKKLTDERCIEIFNTPSNRLEQVTNWQLVQAFDVLRETVRTNAFNAQFMANSLTWDRLNSVLWILGNRKAA